MGPFEYGFLCESCNVRGERDESGPPVRQEIACAAQAVREVLMENGFSGDRAGQLLELVASRIHDLEPQLNQRLQQRRAERQQRRLMGER